MKRVLFSIILLVAGSLCMEARAPKKSNPLDGVGIKYLDANFSTYDRIQKDIHGYAEMGYHEYKSSEELASHLEENGFTIERGVAGIPTAFIATYGSGEPVIGLLGEFDALPAMSQDTLPRFSPRIEGEPGHGCGHNILGTATAAASVAISKWLAEGHKGTVKYFGCPAEEFGSGKGYMTREGCFDGCDAIFDWHPAPGNNVLLVKGLAVVRIVFTFRGKSAHASSAPWNGRSALDGVESFNYMINLMREHIPTSARMHYVITDGGHAPNVVPDMAQVSYFFRHPSAKVLRGIVDRALLAAEGAAKGTGTTMTYEITSGDYEVLNNEHLATMMLRNMKIVGGVRLDDREKAYVNELRAASGLPQSDDFSNFEDVRPELIPNYEGGASTDVGNVSQVAPTVRMQAATNIVGCHTWQQASISGTTIGTKAMMTTAKTMYLTAVELFNSPADVKAAREEYEAVQGKDYHFEALFGDRKPPLDMIIK